MKRVVTVASVAFALLVLSQISNAAKETNLKGIKCPISGKAVIADSATDYKGASVYFCCNNCPKAFKKDTAKYSAKANHQLFATKQAKLVKCPIKGTKLNPATKIEVAGTNVCFCCNGCKGKATKVKGDEQIALVFNDKAFAKGFKVKKEKK